MIITDTDDSPHITVKKSPSLSRKERKQLQNLKRARRNAVNDSLDRADSLHNEPGQQPVVQQKKQVSFAKKVSVKRIPGLGFYSESHLDEIYYSTMAFREMRQTLFRELQILKLVENDEEISEDLCLRGLESELPQGRIERNKRKVTSRTMVLKEQAFQRNAGHYDTSSLSVLYGLTTVDSVNLALKRAKQDAEVAKFLFLESC
eukprot:Nitzschia sp. Nitz4//scaffold151_size53849//160//771//NITZ4_006710-RA/size53849-processed-gene-0.37-mRNA-1//1//CDS//3329537105//8651//frame0